MIKINSMDRLCSHAYNMIRSTANNAPAKTTYIRNFLRLANENKTQGNALIAFFSEFNRVKEGTLRLSNQICDIADSMPAIKEEVKTFINALEEKYPKTLDKRIALARNGEVVPGKVKRSSNIVKTWIKFKELLTKDC